MNDLSMWDLLWAGKEQSSKQLDLIFPSQTNLMSAHIPTSVLDPGSLASGLGMPEAGEHPRIKRQFTSLDQASSLSSSGQSGKPNSPNTFLLTPFPLALPRV